MNAKVLVFGLAILTSGTGYADYGAELASYDFGTADIARDDARSRVYCAVPSQNSVVVIDSDSLEVIATIYTGSNPIALDVSPDGQRLYVANSGSTAEGIAVIDLEGLSIVRHIATVSSAWDVAAGAHNTVYSLEGAIRAYDGNDGTNLGGSVSGVFVYGGLIDLSPDNQTLYYYQTGLSPSSWTRIDVSTWPARVAQAGGWGSNGQDMALSADGQFITFASGAPYHIRKFSAQDPTISHGQMDTGPYPRAVAFSRDGNTLFAVHGGGHIDVWNANTFVKLREISTPSDPRDLACDRKGRVLFAGSSSILKAYYISTEPAPGTLEVEINHAVEIRWDSVAGTLYQVQWSTNPGKNATWHDVGGPILGNGLTISVYDATESSNRKFYRVSVMSP